MNKKFLFLLFAITLFCVNFASAEIFDVSTWDDEVVFHPANQNEKYGYYEINDTTFWLFNNKPVKTIELIENDYSLYSAWNIKEVEVFRSGKLFDRTKYLDRGKKNDKSNVIATEDHYYRVRANFTQQSSQVECIAYETIINETNSSATEVCSDYETTVTESVYEDWGEWQEYNFGSVQPGLYQTKTYVTRNNLKTGAVDWVDENEGHNLDEWALWWDTDWEFRKEITGLNGSISALYTINTTDISGHTFDSMRFADTAVGSVQYDYDIAGLYNGSGFSYTGFDAGLTTNLVSYYNLDEASGTVRDVSMTGATGKVDNAFNFDGTKDEIDLNNAILGGATDFTVSGWINLDDYTSERVIYSQKTGAETGRFIFSVDTSGKLKAFIGGGAGSKTLIGTTTLATGTDYYVTVKRNSGTVTLHVNGGTAEDTDTHISPLSTAHGFIGASDPDGLNFDGKIDELGLWDRALNTTEITSLNNSGAGKAYADLSAGEKTNLVSYYSLDEVGSDPLDSHGSNDGTLSGGTNNGATPNQAGKINTAYDFDGSTADISGTSPSIGAGDFSINLWINPDTIGTTETFYQHITGTTDLTIRFSDTSGHIYFRTEESASSTILTTTGIAATTSSWQMFTLVREGTTLRAYKNAGTPETTSGTLRDFSGATTLHIGSDSGVANYYNGKMDEVGIWNTALTEAQVQELYNATAVGVRVNTQGANDAYVYYGNDASTDNSNASAVYLSPIAGYYFDENANDFVGSSDGTVSGATLIDSGYIDGAYDFDGASSEIVNLVDMGTIGTGDFSINIWINPDTIGDGETIFDTATPATDVVIRFSGTGGAIYFRTQGGGGVTSVTTSAGFVTTGSWQMITAKKTGTTLSLTSNAGIPTTNTGTLRDITGASSVRLGSDTSNYYDGMLDEVYIYDRALNTTEITQIYNQTQPDFALGAEQTQGATVTSIAPADAFTTNNSDVNFQCNATHDSNISNLTLVIDGSDNYTNTTTGLNLTIDTTVSLADGNHNWSCRAETVSGQITSSDNRTLSIDTVDPALAITSPLASYDLLVDNQTLNLNWTVNDTNLDSCWYVYNGTSNNLTCNDNTTSFTYEADDNSLIFYANDTFGNIVSSIHSWIPKVTEVSQTFNNETIEGTTEDFIANIIMADGYDVSSANLMYNGNTESASILSSGQNRTIFVSDYRIPDYNNDTNVSFYFSLVLSDSTQINLSTNVQLVLQVDIDNCSVNTFELLNISLFDEEFKTPLLGDLQIGYDVLNTPVYDTINTLSTSVDNVSSALICSSINLTSAEFAYSAEIRYVSDGYAPELYHIQKADLSGSLVSLNLYDLNLNDSTEFKVTYQDDNFNFVEGAVLQLQRKYISEGIYEIVEAPLTSREGVAVVHADLDSNKYKATVVKDGEVLDIFENIVFKCESELTGECELKLLGLVSPQNSIPISTLDDFAYSLAVVNNTITATFTVPSGSPSSINVVLEHRDMFGNNSVCNKTVTSSAGSIQCTYEDVIGDSYLDLRIYKNGFPQAIKSYYISEDSGLDFLSNNFIILLIMGSSLVGMAFSSPTWIIINSVITMVLGGAFWLLNGMSFVIGFGGIMWLIITATILIFKIAKQEDR